MNERFLVFARQQELPIKCWQRKQSSSSNTVDFICCFKQSQCHRQSMQDQWWPFQKKKKWLSFVCLRGFLNQSLPLLCILLKVRKAGFYTATCNLLLEYSLLEIEEDLLKGMQLECNHSLGTAWQCFLVKHKICMVWVNRIFEEPRVLKSPSDITLGKWQNKKQKQTNPTFLNPQLPARYIWKQFLPLFYFKAVETITI